MPIEHLYFYVLCTHELSKLTAWLLIIIISNSTLYYTCIWGEIPCYNTPVHVHVCIIMYCIHAYGWAHYPFAIVLYRWANSNRLAEAGLYMVVSLIFAVCTCTCIFHLILFFWFLLLYCTFDIKFLFLPSLSFLSLSTSLFSPPPPSLSSLVLHQLCLIPEEISLHVSLAV